jgi:DNA-binding NarL/FixJ family response regulator
VALRDNLKRARESFRRREWRQAYESFLLAAGAEALERGDLERLASAAYLVGREREFHASLQLAHHAHVAAGDRRRAARSAFWLGLTLLLRGDTGQATGWLARARRHIAELDCVEQGYLLLPLAEQQLRQGDHRTAEATASKAVAIGERFADDDLVACARHVEGRALIRHGSVDAGIALLDEAMLSVVTGELSPILTGLVYCSVIAACHEVLALSRAREWTAALSRWCAQQTELIAFTGTCLVHRAEILQLNGAWPEAMTEAVRACESNLGSGDIESTSAAFYRQAELHRLRGAFAAAEEAYRNAARLGAEPQPGFALLRVSQGRRQAACAAMHRVLAVTHDPLRRATLLPAQVEILVAANDLEPAHRACGELEELAHRFETEVLRALAAYARGAVELAQGSADASLGHLRLALASWQHVEAPYEMARTRALRGQACRLLGDDDDAMLELDAARVIFERLGALPDVARLQELSAGAVPAAHRLTPREYEVLRLVAAGKTNKAIAAGLNVSERTVDRHVSNIFTRLNVRSRAAATAYAYEHSLL